MTNSKKKKKKKTFNASFLKTPISDLTQCCMEPFNFKDGVHILIHVDRFFLYCHELTVNKYYNVVLYSHLPTSFFSGANLFEGFEQFYLAYLIHV